MKGCVAAVVLQHVSVGDVRLRPRAAGAKQV